MRCRIYHSLDRPSSIFGIKGRFLLLTGAGSGASAVLAIIVGSATQMIFGMGTLLLGCAASYLLTLWVQSSTDERDVMKVLGHRRLPDCWSMPPRPLRSAWKGLDR